MCFGIQCIHPELLICNWFTSYNSQLFVPFEDTTPHSLIPPSNPGTQLYICSLNISYSSQPAKLNVSSLAAFSETPWRAHTHTPYKTKPSLWAFWDQLEMKKYRLEDRGPSRQALGPSPVIQLLLGHCTSCRNRQLAGFP